MGILSTKYCEELSPFSIENMVRTAHPTKSASLKQKKRASTARFFESESTILDIAI